MSIEPPNIREGRAKQILYEELGLKGNTAIFVMRSSMEINPYGYKKYCPFDLRPHYFKL